MRWRQCIVLMFLAISSAHLSAFAQDGWTSVDINTGIDGSTDFDEANGSWTITANGHDIWDASDGFRFTYQEVEGDFSMSAQVVSVQNTNAWAKAGVMARNNLQDNAAFAMAMVTPGSGMPFEWRLADGGQSFPQGTGNGTAPYYVRLERVGDLFKSSRSQDGVKWEPNGAIGLATEIEIVMTDPIYVGLALTSHAAGVLCTAEFDSVEASFIDLSIEPKDKLSATWGALKRSP
ncbi:MAG: hypothetical protein O3A46_01475 [Candidatus Poribacteria bacterium]|nr:hypothetical protein [Candidatus Poribacteria bacterium]